MTKFTQFIQSAILTAALVTVTAPVDAATQSFAVESAARNLDVSLNQGITVEFPSEARTIFIANPAIASYQLINSRKLIVFGLSPGETTLFALDESGKAAFKAKVCVRYDVESMQSTLTESYPQYKLTLIGLNDGVVVRGNVPTAQEAAGVISLIQSLLQTAPAQGAQPEAQGSGGGELGGAQGSGSGGASVSGAATGKGTLGTRIGKVINQLTITTPNQVTVRVRIAEVNRNLTDQLGIRWGATYNSGNGKFGISSLLGGILDPGPTIGTTSPLHFKSTTTVDALAKEELISILAEPNLSVVSGETANFIAGDQVPFVTWSDKDSPNIEFKDYGVILSVTPTILSGNRISLRLRPEVSEPSSANGIMINGISQPGFVVRRAESTIELASGQSFAIAGLLKNDFSNTVNKIPGLGDVPILGALARSKAFERGETELLIIATAFISTPSGEPYRLPNENVWIPTLFERLFLNANPSVTTSAPKASDFIY